jgi:hypothetical protein
VDPKSTDKCPCVRRDDRRCRWEKLHFHPPRILTGSDKLDRLMEEHANLFNVSLIRHAALMNEDSKKAVRVSYLQY